MSTLQCSFKIELGMPVLPGMVAMGKFDGKNPSLACGTSGNRVFVWSPHKQGANNRVEVQYLNINRELKALHAARLDSTKPDDALLVGSPSHVLAFNVEENKDMYLNEVSDGVMCITSGNVDGKVLCLVGGNCSIQGFDHEGDEAFWTVAGDVVAAMCVADLNKDGSNEVVVGSEDNDIRICKAAGDVLLESTQTDKVTALCHVEGNLFAYALANGTVGVYELSEAGQLVRRWRVKSKHRVCAVQALDIDSDGRMEVIIGWSNGRVEVRRETTGEVKSKDGLDSAIAAIMVGDLRLDGRQQAIVCSVDGQVRGYVQQPSAARSDEVREEEEEELVTSLNQTKQELLCEIKNYEDNMRHIKTGQMKQGEGQLIMIPVDTDVTCKWKVEAKEKKVTLRIATSNSTIVRGVVIFAEGLFADESLFVCPKEQQQELLVALNPQRDVEVDLNLKVMVGQRNSAIFYVKDFSLKMPRFTMYIPKPISQLPTPDGQVTFSLPTKYINKLPEWLNTDFNIEAQKHGGDFSIGLNSLRDDTAVILQVVGQTVTIKTENMDLAGDLVQDMAEFTGLEELSSQAHFPGAITAFQQVLDDVEQYNATRLRLAAESAEMSGTVKELVVRAEDSRLLGDLSTMARTYARIMDTNRALLAEHQKRSNNQEALMAALKQAAQVHESFLLLLFRDVADGTSADVFAGRAQVNQMLQRAAKLRVGPQKQAIVVACREAIKNNNLHQVITIIQTGKAT